VADVADGEIASISDDAQSARPETAAAEKKAADGTEPGDKPQA
jgi:hypothetical protein